MSKKKVVIVGPAYPYRGGQSLVEAHLAHYLHEAGYHTHTVTYTLLYPSVFFPGTTQYDDSGRIHFDHRERIVRMLNSINPLNWRKTARYIIRQAPDVVVFTWWMPFFGPALSTIARMIKKRTKARVVFLIENYISHENRWFDKYLTRKTLNKADYFICQSKYIESLLEENHPETPRIRVTLPVFDCYDLKNYTKETARGKLGISRSKVVMFFGLVRDYKGLDILIKAFPKVLAEDKDILLLIVGENYGDEQSVQKQIEAQGIGPDTMRIARFIPNEEVELYFKAADVCCQPYRSGTQSGITMMSYGFRTPIISTDVGGIAELIRDGETGLITEKENPGQLAKDILRFFELQKKVDLPSNIEKYLGEMGYKNLIGFFDKISSEKNG